MEQKPINVLVVEDSPLERLLLAHILKADPQIRVMTMAEDAERALQLMAAQNPDIVLMDIYLPGMNGFEATRRIMETRPVPIVICSAASTPGNMDVMFQALFSAARSLLHAE